MAVPLAMMAASAIITTGINYLFPSEGPRLSDLRVSSSTYGSLIPEVYGQCRVGANMIWNNPIREQKKKKKQGKGGSYYNEYTYYCDFAMAFCQGPIAQVRRVWADGKLIYDTTGASEAFQSGKYRMRFYLGGEDQLPDSIILASKGEGNTPAYRGLAYVLFENAPLADFGNRLPQMAAEVYNPGDAVGAGASGMAQAISRPTDTSFDFSAGAIDWSSGYLYQRGQIGVDTGILRTDVTTAAQDRFVTVESMGLPAQDSVYYRNSVERVLGCLSDGTVIVSYGGPNNYALVGALDPVSLTSVGSVGVVGPGEVPGDPSPTIPTAAPRATPALASDGNRFAMLGQVGNGRASCVFFEKGEKGGLMQVGRAKVDEPRAICAVGDGSNLFYIIAQEGGIVNGTGVGIYEFNPYPAPTMTKLYSFNNADVPGSNYITAGSCVFDNSSPGVIFTCNAGLNGQVVAKFSIDTGQMAWVKSKLPAVGSFMNTRLLNGELVFATGSTLYGINTDTGEWIDRDADAYADVEDDYDKDDGANGVPITGPGVNTNLQGYDSLRGVVVTPNGVIGSGFVTGSGVTLASIVGTILRKGDFTSKDFDLSALATTFVRGYGWASATDIKSIIDELKKLYQFDLIESNGRLVARMRGGNEIGAVNFEIPQNVLGSTSMEAMDFWEETRMSEADLPERVTLAYMNIDEDFETSTARSMRISSPVPTMFSRQQLAMQVNIVATPNEAKDIVHRILYSQWLERTKHETRLPWAFLDIDPSDTIKVSMNDGRTYFSRVHTTEVGANYAIEVEAFGQDSGAYEAETTADGGGAGRTDTVTLSKPAKVFILNTPLLRDADDSAGGFSRYYSAVGQVARATFNGATVLRSTNGVDFDELYAEPSEVEWGVVRHKLAPPPYGYEALDWVNQIVVYPAVKWFEVFSITDDELWSGANLIVVGDEVIQFRDAIENEDGSWTLSNLLRGRRGTEYACDKHGDGETLIFLDATTVEGQGDTINARGQSRVFKGVAPGQSINATPTTSLIYEPRDLMPYAPADIRRAIANPAADSDITLTWARRTRLGGNLMDGTPVVNLAEAEERYEVYILNAPFDGDRSRGLEPPAASVKRMFNTIDPTVVYTTAMQAEDGHVTNLDMLHVVIYQMSGAVGRGFPGVRSIPAFHPF